MGTRLTIRAPRDYRLARDVCSYGYFVLAPNRWDPRAGTLTRLLDLAGGPARTTIAQDGPGRVRAAFDRGLSRAERAEATGQIARMLRLDEDTAAIREFHRVDPRWRRSGRGRVFRSPTLFEDVIKTVTSCNVTWPSTVSMNRRLCEVLGRGGAFPQPARVARARAATLRSRCRVGYRDARIIELARMFVSGQIDADRLEDPATPDDAVHETLLALPGIGPYGAANIMQLLGRYSRLPLDTESIRHGKTVLGLKGSDRQIMKAVRAHFEPFGRHAFRSYWFELWTHYEGKNGPAWTWVRDGAAL